jgi:hypothetical protein
MRRLRIRPDESAVFDALAGRSVRDFFIPGEQLRPTGRRLDGSALWGSSMPRRHGDVAAWAAARDGEAGSVLTASQFAITQVVGAGTIDIASGQTQSLSGIVESAVSLGVASALSAAAQSDLSVFGSLMGPASGTGSVRIGAGSTFYAAGSVDPTVALDFVGAGGTLDLSGFYLPDMLGVVGGWASGDVVDMISSVLTSATVTGETVTLFNAGVAEGSIALTAPLSGETVIAVPDAFGGTRLLLAPAMQAASGSAPAGSSNGAAYVWAGGGGGVWSNPSAWHAPGGGAVTVAPWARDQVTVNGPSNTALCLAGNGNAATLTTSGVVALAGSFVVGSLSADSAATDVLALTAGCHVNAVTISLASGVLQVCGTNAALIGIVNTIDAGTVWVAGNASYTAGYLTLAGASISLDGSAAIGVGNPSSAFGDVSISSNGSLAGYGTIRAPVINNGTFQASGGALGIYGLLSGSGVAQIVSGATLYLPYGAGSGQQIAFLGGAQTSTLELFGTAANTAAVVIGLAPADVIDIASSTVTQANWTPPGSDSGGFGTLDLGAAGTLEVALAAGYATGATRFQLASDGLGGTTVTMVPCFCEGTILAGPDGGVPVERVTVGSRLVTRSGAARTVRWMGRRGYDVAALRHDPQLRPVRIRAGALGRQLPTRDLCLSPQHALLLTTPLGTRLVPAVALVNGISICREPPVRPVAYIHVELEIHDLLLAEGVEVESFLADGVERRALFHAAEGTPCASRFACTARLEDGPALVAVHSQFDPGRWQSGLRPDPPHSQGHLDRAYCSGDRLELEGWLSPGSQAGPAWIEVMLDGVVISRMVANRWRPDLDREGVANASCGFEVTLPLPESLGCGRLSVRRARNAAVYDLLPAARACGRVIGVCRCSP